MFHIYTDGACLGNQTDNGIGGWGYVILNNDLAKFKESCNCSKDTTNNRMEMQAVINAMKDMLEYKDELIVIYTDSAYVCNCINQKWYANWRINGWKNSKKNPVENKDLWVSILELYESFPQIKFVKVKGHSTNIWNNYADNLATNSAQNLKKVLDKS